MTVLTVGAAVMCVCVYRGLIICTDAFIQINTAQGQLRSSLNGETEVEKKRHTERETHRDRDRH